MKTENKKNHTHYDRKKSNYKQKSLNLLTQRFITSDDDKIMRAMIVCIIKHYISSVLRSAAGTFYSFENSNGES